MFPHCCFVSQNVCDRCTSKGWRIRSACCNDCQAGKNTGFCHHIVVGLEGLVSLLSGLILAGEVNHGKMHWGLKQCNDERHHVPTILLNILAGNECMATYSGSHKRSFEPCMNAFNMDLFDQFGPRYPLIMTQELYHPQARTLITQNKQSQIRTAQKRHRQTRRTDGAKRRTLHRDIVRDQCMIGDGFDLCRPINDIKHIVQQSSPNSLRKMKVKESEGKS